MKQTKQGTWIDTDGEHYDPFTGEYAEPGTEFILHPDHEPDVEPGFGQHRTDPDTILRTSTANRDETTESKQDLKKEMKQLIETKEQKEAKEVKDMEETEETVEDRGDSDDESDEYGDDVLMADGEVV